MEGTSLTNNTELLCNPNHSFLPMTFTAGVTHAAPSGSVGICEIYLCKGSARLQDQGLLNSSLKTDRWQNRSKPVHRLGPSNCIMLPISHGNLSECPSISTYSLCVACVCMCICVCVCVCVCVWQMHKLCILNPGLKMAFPIIDRISLLNP